jgi:ABC-type multidrug transport system fused ATPase/permease subunit
MYIRRRLPKMCKKWYPKALIKRFLTLLITCPYIVNNSSEKSSSFQHLHENWHNSSKTLWILIIFFRFLFIFVEENLLSKQNSFLIEKVQKRFTRYIFTRCLKLDYPTIPPSSERLTLLNLETLESRRLKTDLSFFHKLVTNEIQVETFFPIFCDTFITRTSPRGIYPITSSKKIRNDFFFIRIAKIYIELPSDLVSLPLDSFSVLWKYNLGKLLLYYRPLYVEFFILFY